MRSKRIATTFLILAVASGLGAAAPLEGVMKPRLYRVILPVPDMDRAAGFYRQLLETAGERVSPGRHYFDLGGVILALYDPEADGDPLADGWKHHPNQYIYLAVDDLEAALERARQAGAELLGEIQEMPWGERLFYARDPFGNPVCFVAEATVFAGSGSSAGDDRRVTGLGGVFFKAKDPESLKAWYEKHLGIASRADGTIAFEWRERDRPALVGWTVWGPFQQTSRYFDPSTKPYMFNFRVADLDRLLDELRKAGVQVDDRVEEYPYGRFGWILDPEGNRVELWEPPAETP